MGRKQLHGYFNRQIDEISREDMKMAKKRKY